MARALIDLATLDLEHDVLPEEELRAMLPHRYEFQLIDGVCHLDLEEGVIVGYKDWDDDPWWKRGHVPGRPLRAVIIQNEPKWSIQFRLQSGSFDSLGNRGSGRRRRGIGRRGDAGCPPCWNS